MNKLKERLDQTLVGRGLCETRSQAQGLILAGLVQVNGQRVDKPGTACKNTDEITLAHQAKYVSRGGLKLEQALTAFGFNPADRVAMDVGASTGGFTDCLLQHGARYVHAIDVGYGQLDWRLRQDARVKVIERTHIKALNPESLQPPPDCAVADVSFISLKKVLPAIIACLTQPGGNESAFLPSIIALVKPQFEYRDYCRPSDFKGVITHQEDLIAILNGLLADITAIAAPWRIEGLTESPIQGPKGNREFLLYLQLPSNNSQTLPRAPETFITPLF